MIIMDKMREEFEKWAGFDKLDERQRTIAEGNYSMWCAAWKSSRTDLNQRIALMFDSVRSL